MLQMLTRENKATEREKQGVERDVLALDWVFFHGRPHYFLLERFCTVVSYLRHYHNPKINIFAFPQYTWINSVLDLKQEA